MGLNLKSKRFLEILLLSGLDALTFSANPKAFMSGAVGWSSDRNVRHNIKTLTDKGLISISDERISGSWVAKITDEGKKLALEDVDPEESWNSNWDGKWRTISFDLPKAANRERKQLNSWLKKHRFGHLQGSLWISHRDYSDWIQEIENRKVDPCAVIFLECVPIGNETNSEYSSRAWPFSKINQCYAEHIKFLREKSPSQFPSPLAWFEAESKLWNAAFERDPFLPNEILPNPYKGKEAWLLRKQTFANWANRLSE